MPKGRVSDGGHGVLTDHSIPRRAAAPGPANSWRLRPFPGFAGRDRELGLAYAEVSLRTGDARQASEGMRLLEKAASDAEVLLRLAFLRQRLGDDGRSAELYREVLKRDRDSIAAMVNLGSIYGKAGRLDEAIALWREALKRNPCLSEAGKNLATAYAAAGRRAAAVSVREAQSFCIVEADRR